MTFIPFSLWVIVKRRWNADTRELMIAMYSFFLASFIVLTIIGTAFRGEGMALRGRGIFRIRPSAKNDAAVGIRRQAH